jgi:SAM-dependent methyltransferase
LEKTVKRKSRQLINKSPLVRTLAVRLRRLLSKSEFTGSLAYWESLYRSGGTSGEGSYGRLAKFKAEIINGFVEEKRVQSVIELGCGDGNQLSLARYPTYLGLDVSNEAISQCRKKFKGDPTKSFVAMNSDSCVTHWKTEKKELAVSLDVIYHLVEDDVFRAHMRLLFDVAEKYVCIYSTNFEKRDQGLESHMRHRRFTDWIQAFEPSWKLIRHLPNRYPEGFDDGVTSNAEFYFYQRTERASETLESG